MQESKMDESKTEESKFEPDLEKNVKKIEGYAKIAPNDYTPENSGKFFACGCTFIILLVLYIPFITCDLYYSYNDISCQNIVSPNMDLTIATWLKVNGYLLVSMLFIPVFGIFMDEKNKCSTLSMWIMLTLIRIFVFCWLIVGAVLFWRDIDPMGKCDKPIKSYISARLIMGIIGFVIALKMDNDKKNKK
jgi:hypothetical protein